MNLNRQEIVRPVQGPVMVASKNSLRVLDDPCRDRNAVHAAISLENAHYFETTSQKQQNLIDYSGESIIARLRLEVELLYAHANRVSVQQHIAQQHTIHWC